MQNNSSALGVGFLMSGYGVAQLAKSAGWFTTVVVALVVLGSGILVGLEIAYNKERSK